MAGTFTAINDHEFSVVWRGYDREQVRALLDQIEASFREVEQWATEATARLENAEANCRRHYDVDEAMHAVFAAKDRLLERARRRADRIESEAEQRARVDYEEAAAAIISDAEKEARRIIEGALVTSERVQYESILTDAHTEATRIVEEARMRAERLDAEAPMGEVVVVDLTDNGEATETENDDRLTRYERQTAALPSMGEDASELLKSLRSLREEPSGRTLRDETTRAPGYVGHAPQCARDD